MALPARSLLAYASLLAAALLAGAPRQAAAHGFMAAPMSRNYVHSTYNQKGRDDSWYNYCPHCLAAGAGLAGGVGGCLRCKHQPPCAVSSRLPWPAHALTHSNPCVPGTLSN